MNERFLEIIRFCIVGGLSLLVDFFYGVGNFQLLAVRRLRVQNCAETNFQAGGNIYRLKRRRIGLESSLYVVFRGNCDVALYDGEIGRNGNCDVVELRYET